MDTNKLVTSQEEIRQVIQTEKETLADTVGERGNLEGCPEWAERCGQFGKKNHFAKVCKQKTTNQLHQLEYSEESSSNESTFIMEEEIANVETKKKRWVAPILIKIKGNKRVVECQIDSGASCNVISHSPVCPLF